MSRWRVALTGMLVYGLMVSCASQDSAISKVNEAEPSPGVVIDASLVALTKPIHFTARDGSPIVAPAGTYHVEQAGESQLRLSSSEAAIPIVIAAAVSEHDFDLISPIA